MTSPSNGHPKAREDVPFVEVGREGRFAFELARAYDHAILDAIFALDLLSVHQSPPHRPAMGIPRVIPSLTNSCVTSAQSSL